MFNKKIYKGLKKAKGTKAAAIIRRLGEGWNTERISNHYDVKKMTVAAYRANFTRDAYFPYAYPQKPYTGSK